MRKASLDRHVPELLTSQDVVDLSGISYRQLDYWTRRGWVEPVVAADGSGSQRLFDEAALDVIEDRVDRLARCPSCSRV